VEGKLEFLRTSTYNNISLLPRATLLLHCIAIPPAALWANPYYNYKALRTAVFELVRTIDHTINGMKGIEIGSGSGSEI
jgi:hypothetical protein